VDGPQAHRGVASGPPQAARRKVAPWRSPTLIRARATEARPAPQRVAAPPGQHRREPMVMTGPITHDRSIESLKTAVRWPGADRNTTVILALRLAAAGDGGADAPYPPNLRGSGGRIPCGRRRA